MLIYNAEKNDAAVEAWAYRLYNLQWTTTPPTEEGWYWVLDGEPYIAEVFYSYNHRLCADFTDENVPTPIDELPGITHWLGPLPVPELPEIDA
jgi:hypothetical protein